VAVEEVGVRGVMSCRFLGLNSSLTLLGSFCSRDSQPVSPVLFLAFLLSLQPPQELWLVAGDEAGWVTRATPPPGSLGVVNLPPPACNAPSSVPRQPRVHMMTYWSSVDGGKVE